MKQNKPKARRTEPRSSEINAIRREMKVLYGNPIKKPNVSKFQNGGSMNGKQNMEGGTRPSGLKEFNGELDMPPPQQSKNEEKPQQEHLPISDKVPTAEEIMRMPLEKQIELASEHNYGFPMADFIDAVKQRDRLRNQIRRFLYEAEWRQIGHPNIVDILRNIEFYKKELERLLKEFNGELDMPPPQQSKNEEKPQQEHLPISDKVPPVEEIMRMPLEKQIELASEHNYGFPMGDFIDAVKQRDRLRNQTWRNV